MIKKSLCCLLVLFIAGCASHQESLSDKDVVAVPELADKVPSVTNNAKSVPKTPAIAVPDDEVFNLWWQHTGNQELRILIERAITNSQTLQIAAQRVVQSKARAIQADAEGKPEITAQGSYSIEAPEGGLGSVPPGGKVRAGSDEFEVGLSGNYTFDLWGQRAALAESADLKLRQAVFRYDAQLLTLVSDLSKRYFEYLSLNDRIRNTRETEKALTSMLLAMEDRYEQGDATVVEMQIQRSTVYNSKVRLPTLLKDREQVSFDIARLVGIAPGELNLSDKGLKSVALPAGIQGISTTYLLRRPDIRAIESGMLAADADLDVARKALLPGLSVAADISSGVRDPADLFQPHTLLWSAVSTLSATVFDGGVKEQEIKFAQAVRNELVESYVDTVFNGLQAAHNAVAELTYSGERLAMQEESAQAAKVAQDFGFESYSVGGIDFLTYLDSMQSYQDRQDNLLQLELEYYQAFVDFYAALGGGIPYRDIRGSVYPENKVPRAEKSDASMNWLDAPQEFGNTEAWLVRLTGVYDFLAIQALQRDLPRRYETLQPARQMLVEQIGVGLGAKATASTEDAIWYAVNFSGFANEEEALQWCTKLRERQQRCVVYQPEEGLSYIAQADISDLEQVSYDAGESLQSQREQAEENARTAYNPVVDGTHLGQLYSLLKIEDGHAWLIGNRTHRVWRFPVGAKLAYDGELKSVSHNRAVVSFDHRDYLLRPLYRVERVEKSIQGQTFARMRWGGQSGEVYYHRKGDRLYGKGVIESIDDKSVVIRWGGKRIVLPVMQ